MSSPDISEELESAVLDVSRNPSADRKTASKRFRRSFAWWSRWLHIYLSMFGAATILFFSATGLTLNHPDWFFAESATQLSGSVEVAWLNLDVRPPDDWDEYDFSHQVSRLEIAEFLRSEFGLRGTVSDFLVFEDECELTFQSPGYAATARIDRPTGEFTLDVMENDLVTIMNDLHKGRHTGETWSIVVDVSAVLGVLVGLTGFVLIFFLKLRRRPGLIAGIIGGVVFVGLCFIAIA